MNMESFFQRAWHQLSMPKLPSPSGSKGESPLDALLQEPPAGSLQLLARIVMGLLLLFIIWASFANLQEVAVAEGEVVPQEQIQSIQHLEGGIIEKISVYEGDLVEPGQELVQLNVTAFVASKEEAEINLQTLQLKRARLEAETEGHDALALTEEMQTFRPELIRAEEQVFRGRKQELASRLQVLQEQVQQKQLDVTQLETERQSIASNLNLLREKLRISTDLVKDQLTSQLDHLQLESEVKELEGRLNVINVAIPRGKAALAEASERYRNEQIAFRNEALSEMNAVESEIARTRELLGKAKDQVTRTTITSPIHGIIKSLKTHTIGGVVQPGEIIMEIVPISQNLLIEAHLNPKDIGFVKKGQKAVVKFQTYDYPRYGGLEGEVISVSADSHLDAKTNTSYFLVKVRTERNYLGHQEGMLPITAGMQATVDIHTGRKSVMEYLLKPIIKVKDESFRER